MLQRHCAVLIALTTLQALSLVGCGSTQPALPPDAGCAECECQPGETRSCYDGPADTLSVGVCAAGTQSCDSTGKFGACEGQTIPSIDACNGRDDDCDGAVDEDIGPETCGVGACQVTVETCVNGAPVVCAPLQPAVREFCEGTDDDCDGEVDEGCACLDDAMQPCYGGPEGTRNVGACTDGTQACVNGGWSTCVDDVRPQLEQCNGIDDDCDGQVDESDPLEGAPCSTGQQGNCGPGLNACAMGQLTCAPISQPVAEACNGLDDDCDGQVDNGSPGAGMQCMTGQLGLCAEGITACASESVQCVPVYSSTAETCDGLDNDCDGLTDEGNPGAGQPCTTSAPGVCAAGTTACSQGAVTCVQTTQPSAETCNGQDDDCDGQVDDSPSGVGQPCTTAVPGVCSAGATVCANGAMACQQTVQPSSELCDGLDDDCDGAVDEGSPGSGASCSTGLSGVCAAGTTSCSGGILLCVQNQQPSAETCNLIDDDCDSQVDEDFDLVNDPNNCGSCGNVCGTTAGALCCSSVCVTPDVNNCGACGQSCAQGMVIINELLVNPNAVADSQGEWFELYNPTAYDIDLRGFVIKDLGLDTHTITSTLPVVAPAGQYTVLGLNANTATNGGASVTYQYSSVFLGNSQDELILVGFGNTEVDRVVWTSSSFAPVGISQELGINQRSATANDTLTNWCPATTTFGTGADLGTPGTVNACSK